MSSLTLWKVASKPVAGIAYAACVERKVLGVIANAGLVGEEAGGEGDTCRGGGNIGWG